MNVNSGLPYIITGVDDTCYETPDLFVENVESRNLLVPVLNTSNDNLTLKRGTFLGNAVVIQEADEADTVTVSTVVSNLERIDKNKKKIEIGESNLIVLEKLIENYRSSVKTPVKSLPFEHAIDLRDDVPVSHQPRRLAHGLRDPIKNVVDTLLEKDFIEGSTSAYRSPVVPILKKIG